MHPIRPSILCPTVFLTLACSPVQAAVQLFNNLANWQSSNPGALAHGFPTTADADQQIVQGVTTALTGPVSVRYDNAGAVNRVNNHIEFDNALLNFTTDTSGVNQTTAVVFSFAQPVTAFGFDIQGLSTAGTSSWVFLVDGVEFDFHEVIGAASGFAGFTSTTPVSSISMVNPTTGVPLSSALPLTSGGDQVQFTQFYTAAVPEPTAAVLLGIASLGWAACRKRA